ncbi:MAG TPA: universal stress protein [Burkholderiales bacterium]|nr:universal stress protein [Burkholderiales bacterium]
MKVLLAVDGSECAARAARFVVQLLVGREAQVELVNVQPPVAYADLLFAETRARVDELIAARGRRAARDALDAMASAGITSRLHVLSGDAAPVIASTARELGCGLIIMGTRGLGAVAGLALGSVAGKVIHLAEVPVTVVK